jgi:hypothetical protein
MTNPSAPTATETKQQKFERVLAGEPFKGLKAILEKVTPDRSALCDAVTSASSYADLFSRLRYRLEYTKQIHVQDAFSRVGPGGTIKAVIPYFDIPTQRALPTLINADSSVTTTPEAGRFFDDMRASLKTQIQAQG